MTVPLSQFLARPEAERSIDAAASAPTAVLGALPVDAPTLSGVRYDAPVDYAVRELRGPKMRTTAGVFDEFAAAFQFPYYFGANKDAFDECLRDLDDFVGSAAGYVAVIRDSADLLVDELEERTWFTEAMREAADYWSTKGLAFRVVLQGEPADPQIVRLSP
ncbi:barstar family protein [Nocardia sp. NPDC052112]|uniref:barstar family protein n=1 Tax=Nocardia sp. NPDC052112 TaxID=3155646 RepID=UPI00341BC7B1